MTTLIRIFVTTVFGIVMMSCNFSMNFGPGVDGNRNVVIKERTVNQTFSEIKVSQGLDLYLTQGSDVSLTVEADENLHELILTEVEDNVLKIFTSDPIRNAKARKVHLTFNQLNKLKATSGSDVISTNTIVSERLTITSTSGADIDIKVKANSLLCKATSGSDLKLRGNAKFIDAKATSGSDIKARELLVENSTLKATSGADISINTSNSLNATATSGGDIDYYGNPETVNAKDSSSGSVNAH